jgi:hypothetical protein
MTMEKIPLQHTTARVFSLQHEAYVPGKTCLNPWVSQNVNLADGRRCHGLDIQF